MTTKHKVFILGLRPGADVEEIYRYLADEFGITDELLQKKIIYDTPGHVCATDSLDQAIQVHLKLEELGAHAEVKKPQNAPLQTLETSSIGQRNETEPSSGIVSYVVILTLLVAAFAAFVIYKKNNIEWTGTNKKKHTVRTLSDLEDAESFETTAVSEPEESLDIVLGDDVPQLLKDAFQEVKEEKYESAWEKLTEYLEEEPDNPEAIKAFKYVAFKLAKRCLDAGNTKESIEYIYSAYEISPDDHQIQAQLGAYYYAEKDYDNARKYLDGAIKDGSANPDVHLLLARICYYNDDDMEKASEHLTEAIELAPDRSDIIRFLSKVSREQSIEGDFEAADSEHFMVKYLGVEDQDAAYTILYILDEAWSDIGYDLGDYPDHPVVVILYTNKQFRTVTQAPHWVGGIFDGRIRFPANNLPGKEDDDLRRLLYHEYTHVVIHRITNGRCPVWLNEGLAQLMQDRAGALPDPWLRPSMLQGQRTLPSLRSLRSPFLNLNTNDAIRAYITSYYAVSYFVEEYGLSTVSDVLQEIGKGTNFEKSLHEVTGVEHTDFERSFHEYLLELQ